jgi:deoxyribodipyrimidine photo-lyase
MEGGSSIIGLGGKKNKNKSNTTKSVEKQLEEKLVISTNSDRNTDGSNSYSFQDKTLSSSGDSNKQKITLYVLTRDFRTSDNLTLYKAWDESQKNGTDLCVIFKFNQAQVSKEENPFHSSNGFQFMLEALEQFSEEMNISFIDPIPDDEFLNFLKTLPIHEIYIARDFTPFAKKRVENFSTVAKTIEVDDITVHPINELRTFDSLAAFLKFVRGLKFPELQHRDVNWKEKTYFLTKYIPKNLNFSKFVHEGKFNIEYKVNPDLLARPHNLKKCIENLAENMKTYSIKQVRALVGNPKVSHFSAFLKFGLLSIRAAHLLAEKQSAAGVKKEDILYFQRELYFRDFFYRIAYDKHHQTFYSCNYEGKMPKFISEKDLLDWKTYTGMKPYVSKNEQLQIEENKQIYDRWCKGETEYPIINAAMKEMTSTGYMLNRTRMMTVSYLTWDCGLWWKYPERFFANHLTDYDWVINSINHQNIVNVGFYPSHHHTGFNIKKQQMMDIDDKLLYYKKYDK